RVAQARVLAHDDVHVVVEDVRRVRLAVGDVRAVVPQGAQAGEPDAGLVREVHARPGADLGRHGRGRLRGGEVGREVPAGELHDVVAGVRGDVQAQVGVGGGRLVELEHALLLALG